MLTCPNGHTNESVMPYAATTAEPRQWYECLRCGKRYLVNESAVGATLCPRCKCGAPMADHPTETERMNGEAYPANAFRDPDVQVRGPDGVGWEHPIIEAPASHPEHAHVHEGSPEGPCTMRLSMRKLTGFLCRECGAAIEGLPTKIYE